MCETARRDVTVCVRREGLGERARDGSVGLSVVNEGGGSGQVWAEGEHVIVWLEAKKGG